MPRRAPLVVIVVARARKSVVVTLLEQRLTAGCAVMAMQMAAVALGLAGSGARDGRCSTADCTRPWASGTTIRS